MSSNNNLSVEIGNRIFERRKQIGMTQEQLSEKTGSTPQAISNYERGERELKASTIIKTAEALGVSTDYLLTGKSDLFFSSCAFENITEQEKCLINDIVEKCLLLTKGRD